MCLLEVDFHLAGLSGETAFCLTFLLTLKKNCPGVEKQPSTYFKHGNILIDLSWISHINQKCSRVIFQLGYLMPCSGIWIFEEVQFLALSHQPPEHLWQTTILSKSQNCEEITLGRDFQFLNLFHFIFTVS